MGPKKKRKKKTKAEKIFVVLVCLLKWIACIFKKDFYWMVQLNHSAETLCLFTQCSIARWLLSWRGAMLVMIRVWKICGSGTRSWKYLEMKELVSVMRYQSSQPLWALCYRCRRPNLKCHVIGRTNEKKKNILGVGGMLCKLSLF